MVTERRRTGDLGERIAVQFLERKGFEVIERNFLKPWGEIDIVALKDGTVRFIEVKSVSREMGNIDGSRETAYSPEEMANQSKLDKVAKTASLYMESRKDDREYQVDVVCVYLDQVAKKAQCILYEQVL